MSALAVLRQLTLTGAEVELRGDLCEQPENNQGNSIRRVERCTVSDDAITFRFGERPDGDPDELVIASDAVLLQSDTSGVRIHIPYMGEVRVYPQG